MNPEIARERLRAHKLAGARLATPLEVVRWMCAMQAQDSHQMLWAVGSRLAGGSVADVANALEQGQIVRCWAVRSTLHLVAAEDVGWMTALDAEKRMRADQRRLDQLGIMSQEVDQAAQVAQEALGGKGWIKRSELMDAWEEAGISTAGQRGYHLLFHVAMRGIACIGPQVDKEQGIGLIAENLPPQRLLSGDAARVEVVRRYMQSHAPATIADFVWWSGWTKREAQNALDANGDTLEREELDGVVYWRVAETPFASQTGENGERTYLVAGFDEFLLGYRERGAVLDPQHAGKVVPGGNGIFQPFVVDSCQVVGLWKRSVRKEKIEILIEPFDADPLKYAALLERVRPEMLRFAEFHGHTLS